MSQQEFVSPSSLSQSQQTQGEHALNDDETYHPQHPYYWSPNKAAVPRDEPPSSYDEPMVQRGYQAQDRTTGTKQQASTTRTGAINHAPTGGQRQTQHQQLSPDGDAYERGYRMHHQYNSWQNVPPWARAQPRQKKVARLVLFIALGLFFIGPILHLLGALLVLVIGTVFFALLLALFVILLIGIFSFIFRVPLRQRRAYFRPWRGPWG